MPLVDLSAPLQWPSLVGFNYLGLTLDDTTLNASGYEVGAVFEIPQSGSIAAVKVRVGASVAVVGQLAIRLETVNVLSGEPTGDLYHANAAVTVDVNTANALIAGTFAEAVPATAGDLVAVVFRWVSGDFTIYTPDRMFTWTADFPYGYSRLAGTVSKVAMMPWWGLVYDDGSVPYIPGVWLMETRVTTSYHSGTVPDEVAAEFTLPFGARVSHVWAFLDSDGPATYRVYNASDVVLGSSTRPNNGVRRRVFGAPIIAMLSPKPVLVAGAVYRVSVLPTSTTSIGVQQVVTPNKSATPLGADWKSVTRTDGGAWNETPDRQPLIGLILDQIDAGGGGGLRFHPGMQGGIDA